MLIFQTLFYSSFNVQFYNPNILHTQFKFKTMIKRTNSMEIDENGGEIFQGTQPATVKISNSLHNPGDNIMSYHESKIVKRYVREKNQSQDSIIEHEENKDQVNHMSDNKIGVKDITLTEQIVLVPRSMTVTNSSKVLVRSQKMPNSIRETIVNLASGKKNRPMTSSKISRAILEKYREIKNRFLCQICSCDYDEVDKKKIAKCNHAFCDSCLRHYVDYKISRFQQVLCPYEGCQEPIDIDDEFYKSLNDQLKQKYSKIHTFSIVSKNPNLRLCPSEACKDGILEIVQGVPPKCSKCLKVYCQKCLFAQHEGPCEKNQLDFFQNNLHFRQCERCKNVVEKAIGCNHITCRCGYQFCYLCGAKWLNYQHQCGVNPPQNAQVQVLNNVNNENCCNCIDGDGCCSGFAKILIKILLFPLYLLVIIFLILKTFVILILCFVLSIMMGMIPYTCDFICSKDCPLVLILVIFYPISMLIGICISFSQFFCDVGGDLMGSLCQQLPNVTEAMMCW